MSRYPAGYGASGVSLVPFFSPSFLMFVHIFGGILAIPNIRGGSEFGRTWSDAGRKQSKGNVIDDFVAATYERFLSIKFSTLSHHH